MKKGAKIALIVVGTFILCVLVTAFALLGVSVKAIDKNTGNDFTSQWMKYIKDDSPLTQVVIPGSHDAGTAGMMWMAQTQDKSIFEQLECGTRYIDLRVNKKKDDYYICHSIINGQKLSKVLNEVVSFIDENPSEVLFLDFQKFYGDGCENTLFPIVREALGDRIVTNDTDMSTIDFVSSLTLGQVRGKCLIFWGKPYVLPEEEYNSIFVRDIDMKPRFNSVVHSYYLRANNIRPSKSYVNDVLPEYIELYKQQGDGFFILQGQLTDPVFIVGPKVMEATHNDNMSAFVNGLKDSEYLQYINIIMRDFVGAKKNCEIIALNLSKGFVEDTASFEEGLLAYLS